MFNRTILIILDGVGIGELPDAADYGDAGCATLQHVAERVDGLKLPHLQQLGLGRIASLAGMSPVAAPMAGWGRMKQLSAGKDSVVGHWELAGVVQEQPFATFPDGFPREVIDAFTKMTGLPVLGNVSASGTDILARLGEKHLLTGAPIIYTSVDSVLQIAAHEEIIPPERLYELCRIAERIVASYRICRIIARPFVGESATTFRRTSRRHDFPCSPTRPTLIDCLQRARIPTCSVGKVIDLFAGKGFEHSLPTINNADGMSKILAAMKMVERGLVFANLIDFDMLYGHRRDVEGYARALEAFDRWLPHLQKEMKDDDLLIISADHGCDPTAPGTDHTREYVPLLVWSPSLLHGLNLGVRESFSDVGATIAEQFSISLECGTSFLAQLRGAVLADQN
ncbi:MAG TPA: phosphopentomutase [Geopsychrobacteraceae bacterium]|nr:phosphopentomutase [Geopsychrobacteraceae bacterium]